MNLLPALRREAGDLSQARFAKLLKWSPSKVARLESGRQTLCIGDAAHIARKLRYNPIDLVSRFINWPISRDRRGA